MRTHILVIAALFYSAYGDGIKTKLGQIQAKNLAQAEAEQLGTTTSCGCSVPTTPPTLTATPPPLGDIDLAWCDCDLVAPIIPGSGSGAATTTAYSSDAYVAQGVTNIQIPNSASNTVCEAECCACSAAEESSASSAYKTRVFDICG